ncbi:hypothetical protein A2U01_0000604 [Trifolium medium]|uniref:Reverse transcriptase zinc-binding domain-containing protein n=1 Tax=Trifolium medium TaxID=97028 RepID=A0A392LY80_9FABA|nr:hypothetical protein [Trifolium medium]
MIADRLTSNGGNIMWSWSWKEQLSVSELLQVVELDPNVLIAIRKLWLNDVPSKVAVFGWRLLHERLPTRSSLHQHRALGCWKLCLDGWARAYRLMLQYTNNAVFNGVIPTVSSLVDDIKATSWVS